MSNHKCSPKDYLLESLNYYEKKSASNKRFYYALAVLDIIISALIPFSTLFTDNFSSTKYIVALMGSLVTIISALNVTFAFHKNWIEYRTTAEVLRYHKYLIEAQAPPYNKENKWDLLIFNVYSIVEKENKNWRSALLNNKKELSITNKIKN